MATTAKLSILKILFLNVLIMLIYVAAISSTKEKPDYISALVSIKKANLFFRLQLAINIGFALWYIKNKETHNWQLILLNIGVLLIIYFIVFSFSFVTVN